MNLTETVSPPSPPRLLNIGRYRPWIILLIFIVSLFSSTSTPSLAQPTEDQVETIRQRVDEARQAAGQAAKALAKSGTRLGSTAANISGPLGQMQSILIDFDKFACGAAVTALALQQRRLWDDLDPLDLDSDLLEQLNRLREAIAALQEACNEVVWMADEYEEAGAVPDDVTSPEDEEEEPRWAFPYRVFEGVDWDVVDEICWEQCRSQRLEFRAAEAAARRAQTALNRAQSRRSALPNFISDLEDRIEALEDRVDRLTRRLEAMYPKDDPRLRSSLNEAQMELSGLQEQLEESQQELRELDNRIPELESALEAALEVLRAAIDAFIECLQSCQDRAGLGGESSDYAEVTIEELKERQRRVEQTLGLSPEPLFDFDNLDPSDYFFELKIELKNALARNPQGDLFTPGGVERNLVPPDGVQPSPPSPPPGSPCGNALIDPGEECDGLRLDGQSCLSLGFDGGTLFCNADCTFDTRMCTDCTNGVIEGEEECDGQNLGGNTCEDLGFDGGTLSCSAECTFDTSQCLREGTECGDGTIEGDEECDGQNLGGTTCEDLGFDGGSLSCTGGCSFDTSSCTSGPECGNGILEEGEECDRSDFGGQTCGDFDCDSGSLTCTSSCTIDSSMCTECGGEPTGCQALDGGSFGGDGGCGINSTAVDATNGSVILDPFGDNGATEFSVDGNSGTSVSDNLIIFGEPGHRCQIQCNPPSGFTLQCENLESGATCTENFQ